MLHLQSPLYISPKAPRKETPLQVPHTEPLHRERCSISGALFTYLSKPPEKKPPLRVPLTEPIHRERCSVFRAIVTYLSKFPEKEPPSRFPSQSPIETDAPFLEPSTTSLEVPGKRAPPPGSPSGPLRRGMLITITYLSKFPIKEPLSKFHIGALRREMPITTRIIQKAQ
jgi:hypothetical protein